jgi:hypothetical protein
LLELKPPDRLLHALPPETIPNPRDFSVGVDDRKPKPLKEEQMRGQRIATRPT